jgi:YVTN family beta-propeller protein
MALAAVLLLALTGGCERNRGPETPALTGPVAVTAAVPESYNVVTTDPDGDDICFRIAWQDGAAAETTDYVASGQALTVGHAWPVAGTYTMRAQAVDVHGAESPWSDSLVVTVSARSYPDSLARTVATGGSPFGICLLPDGSRAYVPVRGDETVVIKTSDNTVEARLSTPGYAAFAAASPDGQHVYVTARNAGCVYVVRTSDNVVVDTVPNVEEAWGIAVTPDGLFAYVTQYEVGAVSIIRLSDKTVVGSVSVGAHPWGVCVGADGEYAYVAGRETGGVYVIRTSDRTLHTSVTVPTGPIGVAATPDGSSVWVASGVGGAVSRIKTADHTLGEVLDVGGHPSGVAVTADGAHVFAARYAGGSLKVISTATNAVIDDLDCDGESPDNIAFTPDFKRAYVTQGSSDGVMVFVVPGGRTGDARAGGRPGE